MHTHTHTQTHTHTHTTHTHGSVAARQISNWASRVGFTELVRIALRADQRPKSVLREVSLSLFLSPSRALSLSCARALSLFLLTRTHPSTPSVRSLI
jgi:hypothetical protein